MYILGFKIGLSSFPGTVLHGAAPFLAIFLRFWHFFSEVTGKIAIILSITTLKVKKSHVGVILGLFWPFLAILAILAIFGQNGAPGGPEGQIWGFEAPKTFGDTFYVFLEEKIFFGKKKFWPILAQKDLEKFRVRAQKCCFWSAQGFCGPIWGLLGPFLTVLGPSVGSNVCIKCFL